MTQTSAHQVTRVPARTADGRDVHQAPASAAPEDFRLHLEVFAIRRDKGTVKYLAGSESAMGAFVSDVLPETAAERLRSLPGAAARR